MGRPLNSRFFDPVPASNGESVVSYTFSNRGSYTALPTVTVSAPSLPGGVTATGTLTMRALSATVAAGGTNYVQGDILTVVGGTGTAATFTVATVDGGTGAVLTVTPLARGSYTALAANPRTTTTNSAAGASATLTVTYEVLNFTVASGGSGYVSAADAALTFSPASTTASAAVLTTTGTNVILAHAFVPGGSTDLDADIVKQVGTNDYVMATTEGVGRCSLVASNSPVAGQAFIIATDSAANTYWVTKITAHKAVLQQRAGGTWIYPNGYNAPWSLAAAAGATVQIESV